MRTFDFWNSFDLRPYIGDFSPTPIQTNVKVYTNFISTEETAQPIISKENNSYTWYFEVPGFTKEDLEITLKDYTLFVKGTKKTDFYNKTIKHTLKLLKTVSLETLEASVENGMLFITAKIVEEAKPKTISIR